MPTMKWIRLTLSTAFVCAVGAWSLVKFGSHEFTELTQRTVALENEKRELHEHIKRLGATRRTAQIDILAQELDSNGQSHTRLRWQQVLPDGSLQPPIMADIVGRQLYVEAMVLKFDPELVGKGDTERGQSIAIFRRIFGDQQNPQSGYPLSKTMDPTDDPPADAKSAKLWKRFWELVDSPAVAKEFGVRTAQCEAPAVPVHAGQTWEVTLDASGGLNLKKLREQPVPQQPNATIGS